MIWGMSHLQQLFLLAVLAYALSAVTLAWKACRHKKWAFRQTPQYYMLGSFVYGDAFIFGIFWSAVVGVVLFLQDWLLFWFIWAVFWAIRGLGETIYWFNEQFAVKPLNPHHTLPWNDIFHDGSVWFVYQIICQCVTVVAVILSIYFGVLWVRTI